jgi:hypothetical protein
MTASRPSATAEFRRATARTFALVPAVRGLAQGTLANAGDCEVKQGAPQLTAEMDLRWRRTSIRTRTGDIVNEYLYHPRRFVVLTRPERGDSVVSLGEY